MELHRLKASDRYESPLFKTIYQSTEPLRRKLSRQINPRLFGVTSDIILSWFDDKFIHSFLKFYEKHPNGSEDNLKGYIINSLQIYKFRILRKGYTDTLTSNLVSLEDNVSYINNIPSTSELDEFDNYLDIVNTFLEKHLSEEAYSLLQIELNPPPFILSRMEDPKKKIPIPIILEYLDLEDNLINTRLIQGYRREIKNGVILAKQCLNPQHQLS